MQVDWGLRKSRPTMELQPWVKIKTILQIMVKHAQKNACEDGNLFFPSTY